MWVNAYSPTEYCSPRRTNENFVVGLQFTDGHTSSPSWQCWALPVSGVFLRFRVNWK